MIGVIQRAIRKPFSSPEEEPVGLFHWAQNRRTWLYLGGFLFFSTVIHGAGFYLFQVVYPTPSRVEPAEGKITVLNSGDPSIRDLLQRVQDRSVYFLPVSRDSDVRIELEDSLIPFSPSYGEVSKELIPPEYPWSLPFTGRQAVQELDSNDPLISKVEVEREGDLLDREFAPWSIFKEYLRRAEWIPEIRIRILVEPDGSTSVLEIQGDVEEEAQTELFEVIASTLRFKPREGQSDGWIRIYTKQN